MCGKWDMRSAFKNHDVSELQARELYQEAIKTTYCNDHFHLAVLNAQTGVKVGCFPGRITEIMVWMIWSQCFVFNAFNTMWEWFCASLCILWVLSQLLLFEQNCFYVLVGCKRKIVKEGVKLSEGNFGTLSILQDNTQNFWLHELKCLKGKIFLPLQIIKDLKNSDFLN